MRPGVPEAQNLGDALRLLLRVVALTIRVDASHLRSLRFAADVDQLGCDDLLV